MRAAFRQGISVSRATYPRPLLGRERGWGVTPYECAQQIIHACAGNPDRTSEAANTIQCLVSEAATELLSFHRRRSEQLERERDEWCATAANAKANEDTAIRDLSAARQELTDARESIAAYEAAHEYNTEQLSAARQELRETAAAYVAMREALPPHDSCCSSLDTHKRDALGRWPDCDCDLGRVLAQPLPSLAAKVEAERAAVREAVDEYRRALANREHGDVAAHKAIRSVETALSGDADSGEIRGPREQGSDGR